jgi:hypothetical protein
MIFYKAKILLQDISLSYLPRLLNSCIVSAYENKGDKTRASFCAIESSKAASHWPGYNPGMGG